MSRENSGLSRRELIAGAGAFAFAPNLFLRQDANRPVGWAVLGLGGYAQGQILPAFAHCAWSKLVALIRLVHRSAVEWGNLLGRDHQPRPVRSREVIPTKPKTGVCYIVVCAA